MKVGIHTISYYVPAQYLPIETLANARDIEYAKLNKDWIEVDPDLPIAAIEYRLLQTLGVIEK